MRLLLQNFPSFLFVLVFVTAVKVSSCRAIFFHPRVAPPVVVDNHHHLKGNNNALSSSSSTTFLKVLQTTTPHKTKKGSHTSIESVLRGGAASALSVAKTMTAKKMKALELLSGGLAGTIAAGITNPLEVIKTQLQSSATSSISHGGLEGARGHPLSVAQKIIEQDGLSGFFRGLPPTLIGIIPSRSAYFYVYTRVKRKLSPWLQEGSPGNAVIAGLAAGIAGNSLTNPIWMVRTRMQVLADKGAGQVMYVGYRDAVSTIFREEGIAGFYKGVFASYWGCIEGSIQFLIYEQLKSRMLLRTNERRAKQGLPPTDRLSQLTYFTSAAVSKAVASIATYPHEVARTRLREQARDGIFKYHGMWQTIGLIAKEEGTSAVYGGMGVHLMKVVPNSAIMFLTYEIVNRWLEQFTIIDEK